MTSLRTWAKLALALFVAGGGLQWSLVHAQQDPPPALVRQMGEGEKAFNAGNFDVAREQYLAALQMARDKRSLLGEHFATKMLAQIAIKIGDLRSAAALYEQAYKLTEDKPELRTVASKYATMTGGIYRELRELGVAETWQRKALVKAIGQPDKSMLAEAHFGLGVIQADHGEVDEARANFEKAAAAARGETTKGDGAAEARSFEAQILLALADVELVAGRNDRVIEISRQVLAQAKAFAMPAEQAAASLSLGMAHIARDEFPAARSYFEDALPYFMSAGDAAGEATALQGLAMVEKILKNYALARKHAEAAQIAARKTDSEVNVAQALQMLASVDYALGNKKDAVDGLKKAVAEFRRLNDPPRLASALAQLGDTYQGLDETAAARKTFLEAYDLAKTKKQRCPLIKSAVGLGQLDLETDRASAERYFTEAMVNGLASDSRCATAEAYLGMAEVSLLKGETEGARGHIAEAQKLYEMANDSAGLGKSQSLYGKLELATDNVAAARDHYRKAALAFGAAGNAKGERETRERAVSIFLGYPRLEAVRAWTSAHMLWLIAGAIVAVLLVLALVAMRHRLQDIDEPESTAGGQWLHCNDSETVFVFVHGILSNSAVCWLAPNGKYWPSLVFEDARFKEPDVYLGGYYTAVDSGVFGVDDAADKLMSDLRTTDHESRPTVLSKKKIVFVAHSTGGLVVRYLLERYKEAFKDKRVGLVLVASPSRGSEWAVRLRLLHQLSGNRMGAQLEPDQDLMRDLDRRFADLVAKRDIPDLRGVDLFENHFIVPFLRVLSKKQVVSASNSASYFGAYAIVANTDHFSIAKPRSQKHPSHRALWDFYENRFLPGTPNAGPAAASGLRPAFSPTPP